MTSSPPLPIPLTPLVGRDRERVEIQDLLRTPSVRLVTMTGPGGVGKTRLALEIAANVAEAFPNGVWLVRLEAIRDVDLVLATIAQTVGIADSSAEDLADRVAAWLGPVAHLFLIDNFEQVAEASPILARLLQLCPGLRLLVTSRTSLGVPGEHEYSLAPLPLPASRTAIDPAQALEYPAVRLFVDRAREVAPSFQLNAETMADVLAICTRLDGLPLAIELAAARIKVLTPTALLERLGNRLQILRGGSRALPDRQKTMRDAIGWSYDLLGPDQAEVFRALGVFAGGFTLDAVEYVLGHGSSRHVYDPIDLLDYLVELVDGSLVRRTDQNSDQPRFGLFQTIQEFAVDALVSSGEANERQRAHAEWVIGLTETAEPELIGPHQVAWFDRLEVEHDNIRGALSFAIGAGDGDLAIRIPGRIWRFWWIRGHLTEGRRWLRQVMELYRGEPNLALAHCLRGAGALAEDQGDLDEAIDFNTRARDLAASLGDGRLVGQCINSLGSIASDSGRYEDALAYYEEARTHFERAGDRRGIASCVANIAGVSFYRGDFVDAIAAYEVSRQLLFEIDDRRGAAMLLSNIGACQYEQGHFDEARDSQEQAVVEFNDLGDELGAASALANLGSNYQQLGDLERAEQVSLRALEIMERNGIRRMAGYVRATLSGIMRDKGELAASAEWAASGIRLLAEVGDPAYVAGVSASTAELAMLLDRPEEAATLYGAVAAIRERLGVDLERERGEIATENRAALRRELGDERYAQCAGTGAGLSDDQVVAVVEQLIEIARKRPADPVEAALAEATGLAPNDLAIVRMVVSGTPHAQIASALQIEKRLVAQRIASIYAKTGTESQATLAAWAFKHRIA